MLTAARPSSARAWPRRRGPGSMIVQPSLRPPGAGEVDGGQLQQAVREDQAEEHVALAVGEHQAADEAEVELVQQQDVHGGDAEQDPEDQRDRGDPGVVGPYLERERRRRMLGVVVREVVLDELADLGGVPTLACTSGLFTTQIARASATRLPRTALPSHHHRIR